MSTVFFTSDEHYNHEKSIELGNRPFSSVTDMNETMIKFHNDVVKKGDRVYHLGDFAWFGGEEILSRLNGIHYLIRGNHDRNVPDGFVWVEQTKMLKVADKLFWLSHYPHRQWPQAHYGAYHLYGHVHGNLEDYGRSGDVGVDRLFFTPWNIDQIIDYFSVTEIPVDHRKLRRENADINDTGSSI